MMVADSDILIDFLRGRGPGSERIAIELAAGRLATTAVNAFELLSGAKSEGEQHKVATLLAALTILPFNEKAALLAAQARRHLETQGSGIGIADYLIAGVCQNNEAVLLTRNLDHFERVPNLKISGRYL